MAAPSYETDATWRNHLGNQSVKAARIYDPRSIDDVVAIVRAAEAAGVTTRAVGSGHSWSDVALTDGYLMRTGGLARVPAPEPDFFAPAWEGRSLVRTEAGIRLQQLNAWLDPNGLALLQMGGYDKQTIAGVISTSTHGSGTAFGPLNDFVHSLDVVASGGRVMRIERAGGPTDRAAYEAHHGDRRALVQDDDVFDAVAVGMGCMGVVCTALVEVGPRFYLREVREMRPWTQVKADLIARDVFADNEHWEIVFSPYEHAGDRQCLVTTRNTHPAPDKAPLVERVRGYVMMNTRRSQPVEDAARNPKTPKLLRGVLRHFPRLAPLLLQLSMRALVKEEYVAVSYKVFNIGEANRVPAYSGEIAIPTDGRHIEAVEKIFEVADEQRRSRGIYQTSPIALRFVKASPAHLSMMNGSETMMIELIELYGTNGALDLIAAYEEALMALGGRPHWGQINAWSRDAGHLSDLYPRYEAWQRVHRDMNATGVFDSTFSRRVGIAQDRSTP